MKRKTTTLCVMDVLAMATLALPTENTYHAVTNDWYNGNCTNGIYQECSALKEAGLAVYELVALKSSHDALRATLLPQAYPLGFLNPDVMYLE